MRENGRVCLTDCGDVRKPSRIEAALNFNVSVRLSVLMRKHSAFVCFSRFGVAPERAGNRLCSALRVVGGNRRGG
jgi:hypothetical protein